MVPDSPRTESHTPVPMCGARRGGLARPLQTWVTVGVCGCHCVCVSLCVCACAPGFKLQGPLAWRGVGDPCLFLPWCPPGPQARLPSLPGKVAAGIRCPTPKSHPQLCMFAFGSPKHKVRHVVMGK